MGTGQQRENRLLRHGKAEVQKEKTYTKSQNDAGKINRNDFDAEFWMGGKHK